MKRRKITCQDCGRRIPDQPASGPPFRRCAACSAVLTADNAARAAAHESSRGASYLASEVRRALAKRETTSG